MKLTDLFGKFQFSPIAFLVYVILLGILCSLGNWQLGRSEQKKQLLQQQQQAITAEALQLNQQAITDVAAARYRKVSVQGRFDAAHQFLIDNQVKDGKVGYFVMTPFRLDQGVAILVNRGWIAAGQNRQQLPDVQISDNPRSITGRINAFPSVGIRLQGAETPAAGWPAVVQVIDSQVLANALGYALSDFQIELDEAESDGYRRDWQINTLITPEKHLAYAVQWFALALALTGLFVWISIRKSQ